MKVSLIPAVAALALASCGSRHSIEIANTSDVARDGELTEVALTDVRSAVGDGDFVLRDDTGAEVPYQITYDSLVVFPVSVAAGATVSYTIESGVPAPVDTVACGSFYERRKDDFAWENDRSAFRAYGPALQQSGERAFGYDIWTKSVSHPVVAKRYNNAFAKISNFHVDNGDGMDVYAVGPTLGGGTAALIDSTGAIVYPWCFESYEILDNGPLRFTVRLRYPRTEFGCDSAVTEVRVISLDRGEYLNRTEVTYEGLSRRTTMAPGIVVHRQNPDGFDISAEDAYMAYADLTDNADGDNGVIYVGVVAPGADTIVNEPLAEPTGDAVGHLLAKSTYAPGGEYVYYWGSGWSKGSMPDWQTWKDYLANFRKRIDNPLKTTVK